MSAVAGAVALAATLPLLSGCEEGAARAPGARLQIVAAESFWGSIAAQLGGRDATVRSIVSSSAVDPHDLEPSAEDARAVAGAQLTIVNGVGYDPWAPRLLAADSTPTRAVLDVGALLKLAPGENPHRWYDPADVDAVARAITARLQALDPARSIRFAARYAAFERFGLRSYHAIVAAIRRGFDGTAIGASESIVVPLASALGLRLITPAGFMNAVAEGGEITAQDMALAQRQIVAHRLKVWIFNPQNDTPEVGRVTALARASGIPVVMFTETPSPATASFQRWQVDQLRALRRALSRQAVR